MNPDLPQTPREELEASLTALILGELPAEQAFALGRAIEKDAELAQLYERLKQTIRLVRETSDKPAAEHAPLKLSDQRRAELLQRFKTVKPREFAKPRRREMRWLEVAAVVAIVGVLAAISLPTLSRSKGRAQSVSNTFFARREDEPSQSVRDLSRDREPAGDERQGGQIDVLESGAATTRTLAQEIAKEHSLAGLSQNLRTESQLQETEVRPTLPMSIPPNSAPVKAALSRIALPSSVETRASAIGGDAKRGFSQIGGGAPGSIDPAPEFPIAVDTIQQGSLEGGRGVGSHQLAAAQTPPAAESPLESKSRQLAYGRTPAAAIALPAVEAAFPTQTPSPDSKLNGQLADLNQLGERANGSNLSGYVFGGGFGFTTGTPRDDIGGLNSRGYKLPQKAQGDFYGEASKGAILGDLPQLGRMFDAKPEPGATTPSTVANGFESAVNGFAVDPGQKVAKPGNDSLALNSSEYAYRTWSLETGVADKQMDDLKIGRTSAGKIINGGTLGLEEGKKDETMALHYAQVSDLDLPKLTTNGGTAPSNVFDLNVVGYGNFPAQSTNFVVKVPNDSYDKYAFYRQLNEQNKNGRQATETAEKPVEIAAVDSKREAEVIAGRQEESLSRSSESFRRRYGGLAPSASATPPKIELPGWSDTQRQKQGNIGLADGSVQQFSRSKLQKELRSSGGDAENSRPKRPEPQASVTAGPAPVDQATANGRRRAILSKLDHIRVDTSKYDGVPLAEVLKNLSDESKKHDPQGRGINFIIVPSLNVGTDAPAPIDPSTGLPVAVATSPELGTVAITTNFPSGSVRLADALDAVVKAAGEPLKYSIEDYGVVLSFDARNTEPTKDIHEVRPKPAASALIPQPEVLAGENAFSTFSLNVSDVSFKLAGASLEKRVMPEPATVRSEEFINAFDYRDPEPPPGVPVAFAWERSGYPFAQNRDLLRFSIKTAALGRQVGRPLNLVLLLDNSGSMERADRVRIIHEALRVLATQLQPQDKLSVVTFARTPRLWVDGVPGSQAAQVAEDVSSLTPQGGTNLEDAMNLAYQTAQRHYLANGVNRVVLLTDGAANLGDVEPATLKQKVEAQRKQGIALDCFGIGWEGYNDDLLEVLSRNGDGRYGFLNSPEEAATEFAGQLAGALHVAASDVKVQVEFNPGRVTAYRQIGYAKHQLTKEQFRDKTVDAAEIGAAESGNALYTIEVKPAGEGPIGTVRVRYKVPGTEEYHEHEWPVPYTGNATPLEQSSSAMRLAATASAFSEWLVASPYAGEVTPDLLLGYLNGVPDIYGADARPKKLEWMIRQAKSVVGSEVRTSGEEIQKRSETPSPAIDSGKRSFPK